jgi:hypothetical protein
MACGKMDEPKRKKTANCRNEFQKAKDRSDAIELMKQGYSYIEIAQKFTEDPDRPYTISATQITVDMKPLRMKSIALSTAHMGEVIDQEIKELEKIIRQAESALADKGVLLETNESGVSEKGEFSKVKETWHNVSKPIAALLTVKANAKARITFLRGGETFLKSQDLNHAVSVLIANGYEITAPGDVGDE